MKKVLFLLIFMLIFLFLYIALFAQTTENIANKNTNIIASGSSFNNMTKKELTDEYNKLLVDYNLIKNFKNLKEYDQKRILQDYDELLENYNTTLEDYIEGSQERKEPEKSSWQGTQILIGFHDKTGDVSSRNVNAGMNLDYDFNKNWEELLIGSYSNTKDKLESTKTFQISLDNKFSYNFDDYNGMYTEGQFIRKPDEGYSYIATESFGYKRRFFAKNTIFTLDWFLGPSFNQRTSMDDKKYQSYPGVITSFIFEWSIAKNLELNENFQCNKATIDTTISSNVSLQYKLSNRFNLEQSFEIDKDFDPLPDKHLINTSTSFSIVYNV